MEGKEKVYVLKEFTEGIILSLRDLHNRTFPNSQWTVEGYRNQFTQTLAPLCVVIEHDEICGFVMAEFKESDAVQLSNILVDESCRGKGYAQILVAKLFEEVLKNENIKKIILHFRESNNLEKFYAKFGFKNHQIDGSYKNGEPKHYMEIDRDGMKVYLREI